MSRKKYKQRPQPPRWFWLDTDNCWFCKGKNRHNCNGCKLLKQFKRRKECNNENLQ